jgi:hypothetical protein
MLSIIYILIFGLLFLFIYNIFFPSKEGLSGLALIGKANADLSQNQSTNKKVDKFYNETLPNFFDKKIKISGTDIEFTYKDDAKPPSGCHQKDNGEHQPSTYECETYEIGNMEDKIMSKKGIQQWFKPLTDRLDVEANKIISDSK